MLSLVNNINGALGWVMAVVIYGMIFNTAIGMFYSLGRRLSAKRPDKFRIIFVGTTFAGFVLSFLGFKSLIATVYPALGYLGVFPNFALSSLNYVGLSLILSVSMAIVMGGSHLHRAIHPSLRPKRMARPPAVKRPITPVDVREAYRRRRLIR